MFRTAGFFLLLLVASLGAKAQCPDCTPDESCVSADGLPAICPEVLPVATANSYYEEVLTFYLPANIEDPDSGIPATLDQVTVTSVTGLPLGIDVSFGNGTGVYFPASGENLGCATLCGTAILPGTYTVTITADVLTTVFGLEFEASQSFSRPFTVVPGASGNASFSASNVAGCGSVEVAFEALVNDPLNPTSWAWDFANGNTSDQAIPPVQIYDTPGEYPVTLTTTVSSWELTEVDLTSIAPGWSGDIEELTTAWDPDPYFVVLDADGNGVYTSNAITDVNEATWTGLSISLSSPPYSVQFWDQDNGGIFGSADDNLGTAPLVLEEGIQPFASSSPAGSDGYFTVQLTPVVEFTDTLWIQVFPYPNTEVTIESDVAFLDMTDVTGVLWTLNGDTLNPETPEALPLNGWGVYQAQLSNSYGCSAWTEPFVQCPDFELSWSDSVLTAPAGMASYTWYFNGLEVTGEEGPELAANLPGNYTLTVTTDYGCTFTTEVYTVAVGVNETALNLGIWPNPTTGIFVVQLPKQAIQLSILDLSGKAVLVQSVSGSRWQTDVGYLPRGVYFVEVYTEKRRHVSRLILH